MAEHDVPTFSIVVPTYMHGHFIARCIDSVRAQTCASWEMIIVNNFSTDDTEAVVASYHDPRITLINFANNGIIGASRNVGIRHAKAEWICFLDSDDWWYPNKLEECSKHLDDSDIIYHDLDVYTDFNRKPVGRSHTRQVAGNVFADLMFNGNALSNSSVVVRKSILEQAGCVSERRDFVSIEDFDCWLNIAKITKRFTYIPVPLGGYWRGANTWTAIKYLNNWKALVDAHINDFGSEKEKATARKVLKYSEARIYHLNGHYGKALVRYLQAGPSVLSKRLRKFLRNKKLVALQASSDKR